MVSFNNYNHFKNYCYKIMHNNDWKITQQVETTFNDFKLVEEILSLLKEKEVIEYEKSSLECVVNFLQKKDLQSVIMTMEYLTKKTKNMLAKKVNIYFLHTSLSSMLGMETTFTLQHIMNGYNETKEHLYPEKIKCIEIIKESSTIRFFSQIDLSEFTGKRGIYFIYDEKGVIAYIGKSNSCVVSRCFSSVEERNLYSFSKIEIRCTKTNSDTGIYEPYYISKYKPYLNVEFLYDDETTIALPELDVTKTFREDDCTDTSQFEYTYYKQSSRHTMSVREEIGKNIFLDNKQTRSVLKEKGLFEKYESKNKAHSEVVQKSKERGLTAIEEVKTELYQMRKTN